MEPLLTVERAAELLAISPWTVRAYIRKGHMTPVRIGRRVLLSNDEVERISKGCCLSAKSKESEQ
jgi:excisionase family DNA binding protein